MARRCAVNRVTPNILVSADDGDPGISLPSGMTVARAVDELTESLRVWGLVYSSQRDIDQASLQRMQAEMSARLYWLLAGVPTVGGRGLNVSRLDGDRIRAKVTPLTWAEGVESFEVGLAAIASCLSAGEPVSRADRERLALDLSGLLNWLRAQVESEMGRRAIEAIASVYAAANEMMAAWGLAESLENQGAKKVSAA
jgi:hypothetical protein